MSFFLSKKSKLEELELQDHTSNVAKILTFLFVWFPVESAYNANCTLHLEI